MKKLSALICAIMMIMTVTAGTCFAATTDTAAVTDPGFELVSSSPEDGATGVAVDNFSIKIYFSKEMMPKSSDIRNSNAKQFVLKDEEGKKIPIRDYYRTSRSRARPNTL